MALLEDSTATGQTICGRALSAVSLIAGVRFNEIGGFGLQDGSAGL